MEGRLQPAESVRSLMEGLLPPAEGVRSLNAEWEHYVGMMKQIERLLYRLHLNEEKEEELRVKAQRVHRRFLSRLSRKTDALEFQLLVLKDRLRVDRQRGGVLGGAVARVAGVLRSLDSMLTRLKYLRQIPGERAARMHHFLIDGDTLDEFSNSMAVLLSLYDDVERSGIGSRRRRSVGGSGGGEVRKFGRTKLEWADYHFAWP